MAANNDYGQLFCEAVDTIVKQRLEQINFDTTSLCTITDDSKKDQGKYKVKVHNGLAEYVAYSASTDYSIGDNVYVQIPNSDMNEQKFIIAKKTDESGIPLSYKPPFASFVNITGNLVSNTNGVKAGLIANEEKSSDKPNAEEIVIWAYNSDAYTDKSDYGVDICQYNKLGIQAQFRSWLGDLRVKSGSYGLKLRVEAEKEDAEDIENLPEEERINNELLYYDFILDSTDMVGNPYDFGTYYQQEIVFDISDLSKIKRMELQFYQKKNFYNEKGNLIAVLADPNLFVKDVNICFGFDISEFDEDKVQIFSLNSPKYDTTADPPESNHKLLQLRWIHKDEDGNVYVVPDNDEELDFKILWYKYRLGTYSHTQKSGADWTPMSLQFSDYRFNLMIDDVAGDYPDQDTSRDDENFAKYMILDNEWIEYNQSAELGYYRQPSENKTWLIPDITLAEESIKAIISYCTEPGNENTRKYLVSNILNFTNREEVVSKPTVDAVTALTIVCDDGSNGNYMIYNQGNELLDNAQGAEEKTFTAYFKGAPLQNAEYIEWIIPSQYTMIKMDNSYLGAIFPSEVANKKEFKDKTNNQLDESLRYHIYRFGRQDNKYSIDHVNTQKYKIKSYYTPDNNDNTIQCKVVKDKITYTATKELVFGPSGTSGADHTLIIDFDDENVNAIDVYDTNKTYYNIRARLYTYEGKEVNFNTINDYTIEWSWYEKYPTDSSTLSIGGYYEENEQGVLEQNNTYQNKKSIIVNSSVSINTLAILQAKLTWRDNETLVSYFSIPLRKYLAPTNGTNEEGEAFEYKDEYSYISGTDKIIYMSDGIPYYTRSPYKIYKSRFIHNVQNGTTADDQVQGEWKKINVEQMSEAEDGVSWQLLKTNAEKAVQKYYPIYNPTTNCIEPIPIYIEDSPFCGIQCLKDNQVIWTQPILVVMNKYPNGAVNRWDGKGLEINEKDGYIIGSAFAAGKKETDNTFSGVMLGDWDTAANGDVEDSIGAQTGVYGFHHGAMSYALKQDGTMFVGKSGNGRIYFDGNNAQIYSAGYNNTNAGMMIDLGGDDGDPFIHMKNGKADMYLTADSEGSYIKFKNGNNKILISSNSDDYPLSIGDNFYVEWNGDLYAQDAYLDDAFLDEAYLTNAFLQGILQSNNGLIGGWYIDKTTLKGGGKYDLVKDSEGRITSIEDNGGSTIILDSSKSSIAGGILKSTDDLPVFLDGVLSVSLGQNSYNASAGTYGFIGAMGSNMGTVADTDSDGVGLWAAEGGNKKSVVKATTSNAGLAFSSYSIWIESDGIHFSTGGDPEKQHGIYARFA